MVRQAKLIPEPFYPPKEQEEVDSEAESALSDFLTDWVNRGLLSRYQISKLIRGHWRGLSVGPYRLLCPLGRGAVGVVYLARRTDKTFLQELCALKVLAPNRAKAEPRTLARFQREMAIGDLLKPHPCLSSVLDHGEVNGVHFLAMDYIPGKSVRMAVLEAGSLPIGQACRVHLDATLGLQQVHGQGLVHRDLKPANIMIKPDGRGALLDFGFALRIGEPTPPDPSILGGKGYTLGTMDYIAPEQAVNAATVGPEADIYSLGCSLYHTLSGQAPFPVGTAVEKIRQHRTVPPVPMTDWNPTLPAELDRFVRHMMAKSLKDRPTISQIIEELQYWADPVVEDGYQQPETVAERIRAAEAQWSPRRFATEQILVGVLSQPTDSMATETPPSQIELPNDAKVKLPWNRTVIGIMAGMLLFAAFLLGIVIGRIALLN